MLKLLPCSAGVWYFKGSGTSGNSSVVECDLAKVEVAGSNPVSRSTFPLSDAAQVFNTAHSSQQVLIGAVAKW